MRLSDLVPIACSILLLSTAAAPAETLGDPQVGSAPRPTWGSPSVSAGAAAVDSGRIEHAMRTRSDRRSFFLGGGARGVDGGCC